MEHIEAVSEGEWTSLSEIYTAEEVDFMSRLLENFANQTSIMGIDPETFSPGGNYEALVHLIFHGEEICEILWYSLSCVSEVRVQVDAFTGSASLCLKI